MHFLIIVHCLISWDLWWSQQYLGQAVSLQQSECPEIRQCSFSSDRDSLNQSDLVIFSYSDISLNDMPPKYLLGPKWALFMPEPTERHRGRIWPQFFTMFDVLISYFPHSNIQMYSITLKCGMRTTDYLRLLK